MRAIALKNWLGLALVASSILLAGCERPPMQVKQQGYRGNGMEQVTNPRTAAAYNATQVAPDSIPAASPDGPRAKEVYKNVQVLGDLSVGEFTRHMVSITSWVSPEQGCNYCHNVANFADDSKYQKVVARRMIQMTQNINQNWQKHVGNTGVTCYTCHRGNNNPKQAWYTPIDSKKIFMGNDFGQNKPSPSVGLASLPYDPLTPYLLKTNDIRVGSTTALPSGNKHDVKDAEGTYALMMYFSKSLGVNCTFCHNAQNFQSWNNSPPTRVTAWHGIKMAQNVNNEYIVPLTSTFPATELGKSGDIGKVACATCHQGASKPLLGKSMLKDHPELSKVGYSGATTTVTEAALGAVAAATAPAGVLGKVLFDTGKIDVGSAGSQEIATVAKTLAQFPELKVNLSGFADSRGDLEVNKKLSKSRAEAVRDGLTAAGVAADRINLLKPEMAVAGGAEADARRVEIVSVK
jgi:photosynthetic reaction center cytochrome c subunit